eukprot:gene12306-biopygen10755
MATIPINNSRSLFGIHVIAADYHCDIAVQDHRARGGRARGAAPRRARADDERPHGTVAGAAAAAGLRLSQAREAQ